MGDILALVEHRRGEIRDATYEVMTCGRKLADQTGSKLTAVLLGSETDSMVTSLKPHAHRILVVDDPAFKDFNNEFYQAALADIIGKEQPFITLIGHTAYGIELTSALGTHLDVPFTTDCIGVEMSGDRPVAVRQVYDGKLNERVSFREGPSYLLSLRAGATAAEQGGADAEVVKLDAPALPDPAHLKFLDYIEAVTGDVDITKADIIVSVGRGIKEQKNIPLIEEFAEAIGGVVACSRPVADAEWLPKDRLVGSSGKTIKPKLYVAIGISGSFQHLTGMKNSDTIVAINKDPEAPIFNEADYGIVDDLFKVLPVLKNSIAEMKQ
ncbi:MAG: electron transfer flavoprotein subunit alpha/FixB family protein [bacterium]|jgi:electron transfer flavoprotein alpha subunit